jgi:hypothetical protein
MYVACITYMRHTQNNSLSSYFGFFMLSSSINLNHLNYLNILIDIYDKSGIRALLTNACEICTMRRSRVLQSYKFVNDALVIIITRVLYNILPTAAQNKKKQLFFNEVKIDHY